MFILKYKRLINWISFLILILVLIANTIFTIDQFKIIEEFNEIQSNLPLFTDSLVIFLFIGAQLIAGISVVLIETLFITFATNFMIEKKLTFSNYLFPILLANIFTVIIHSIIIKIFDFDNFSTIKWMAWSPVLPILIAVFVYIYLSIVDKTIAIKVKVVLGILLFSVFYGLQVLVQLVANI